MNPERWQKVTQIYKSAIELDAARRDALLAEACAGDDSLRKEVESLLACQPKVETFVESTAIEVPARALEKREKGELCPNLVGHSLLHYRIAEKIGEGGMGEVYRARDEHLERDVAIKVLPDAFTGSPERLARFEREAKLLASLNHPNVAAIYGFEEADGRRFLVLELVQGQTLAHRLGKGALPLEETLDICLQIAEGLEAAHELGIIHRDLKPANVMITAGDKAKILDFGLAKALADETQAIDSMHSPTIIDGVTRPGVILGTAAYMSPEQAKGKSVDKRADMWAFGCVLYECLTGKRAYHGETITETLAAILKGEPDWQALPAATPWRVKVLLQRCLRKNPRERLHDIADARIELSEPAILPAETVAVSHRLSFGWLSAVAAILLLAGILIGPTAMKFFQPNPSASVMKAVVKLEPGHCLDGMRLGEAFLRPTRTAMVLSRDGRFIVYSAVAENLGPQARPQLYLRRMDQMEAKSIAGTEGGISPFLSPDDRQVGFWADDKLKKVSIDGGVPVTLCDVSLAFGASWGSDNNIIFSPRREDAGLWKVSAEGGNPETLTAPDKTKEEISHRLPYWLPGGKGVLFTIMRDYSDLQPSVAVLELKTRRYRVLLDDAADARYVPTGHLVFLRQGTLMAVPFDLEGLGISGQPVPAIANIMQALNLGNSSYNTAAGQFSISDSGWLVYAVGGIMRDLQNSLVWVDQEGTSQPITSLKADFNSPRLSPDGQRVAYVTAGREWRVRVFDINRGMASPVTGEGKGDFVTWSADGKQVFFGWRKTGHINLYRQPVDGSSAMERLTTSDYFQIPGSLSPDGTTLAFVETRPGTTGNDILLLDLQSRRVRPFCQTPSSEMYPEFSPDGRWLAYSSNQSGRHEVFVQRYPGGGSKWQISNEGGMDPLWARNGRQMFYRWKEQVWVVDIRTDGGFSAGKPRLLFEKPGFILSGPSRSWDLSLHGRFVMVKEEELVPQPVVEMILVQNWFEELKRLIPKAK